MGLVGLEQTCQALINHGSPKELPIALIQQGTLDKQKVITGTLATLPDLVANEYIKAPTIIIIGEVVLLRERLEWFTASSTKNHTII
jgi:uroporphyrin-III C-methyltransferase / precorrin-2 dehydrogenase / sirohydrochlorin ferrochelatase